MKHHNEPSIEFKNVRFSYESSPLNEWLLQINRFEIPKASKFFIYGPSGSGKSTLLNLMTGILTPNEGEVSCLGQPFSKMGPLKRDAFRGNHIGYIFQNFNLIPYLTVKENIHLGLELNNKYSKLGPTWQQGFNEIISVLALEDDLHKKAYQMSIGGQQRVAAARALIGKPEIIIADEPTSSLDDDRTGDFLETLVSLTKKNASTLIFVSHDLRLKEYFDYSFSLQDIQKNKGVL